MISATTRPPREGEKDGVDYYFINRQQFEDLINKKALVEFATFRGWYYGVPFSSVQSGYINIGVFNPQGLRTLQKYRYEYDIVPVYIEEKLSTRMRRSHDREGKWKIEFLRRA
jgi:guanylate kinase